MTNQYYQAHVSKKVPRSEFKPTREFCQNAIEEFLKNGGKISKFTQTIESSTNDYVAVEEFLTEQEVPSINMDGY